jgi:hypothetical protein
VADNGESTFTQVRVCLQEQYNIKSTKDVKLHLADLSADDRLKLIEKVSHGSGNVNSYRIRPGFNSLKRLHNYLDQYGAVPAADEDEVFPGLYRFRGLRHQRPQQHRAEPDARAIRRHAG